MKDYSSGKVVIDTLPFQDESWNSNLLGMAMGKISGSMVQQEVLIWLREEALMKSYLLL